MSDQPQAAKPEPAKTDPKTDKHPGKFRARVGGTHTSLEIGDLLVTNVFADVTFDQAADIQEFCDRENIPYIIEEIKD